MIGPNRVLRSTFLAKNKLSYAKCKTLFSVAETVTALVSAPCYRQKSTRYKFHNRNHAKY